MRNIKELLIILMEYIKPQHEIQGGLCHEVTSLYKKNLISSSEKLKLENYIHLNPPYNRYSMMFYWQPKIVSFRLTWLKEHIEFIKP